MKSRVSLAETADLMEIAGEDGFRIRSYRNAASVIDGYPEPISVIVRDPERKVTDVPGIGKGIASAIEELEKRGSFERRDQMLELYPPTALELLKIQGLGTENDSDFVRYLPRLDHRWTRKALPGNRRFASCHAWARSWKRRFSGRLRSIASARGVS
ncbi:MAG: hypothetical protein WDO18_06730 [Acidobacteriota bacterium]